MRIVSAGLTDLGKCRLHNEDSFAFSDEQGLYIVADGMGGHAAGEIASRTAVSVIFDFVSHQFTKGDATWPPGIDASLDHHHQVLMAAAHAANQCLCNLSEKNAQYTGMGTTLVAMMVNGANAYIAHVGDSRVYLLRDKHLQMLTHDHTWVNEQVQRNLLSTEEAREHRWRNVITRALGSTCNLAVDAVKKEIRLGDWFLLCSDGLTSMVADAEIEGILSQGADADPRQVCRLLVDKANAAGGEDNISLVLVRAVP